MTKNKEENQIVVPPSISEGCNALAQEVLALSGVYNRVVAMVKQRDVIIANLQKEVEELKLANEETQEIEVSEE